MCGCQLLFQLGDHDSVVSEGLLHCQQADLRDVKGVFAKRQRFAVVPLEERGRRTKVFKLDNMSKQMQAAFKLQCSSTEGHRAPAFQSDPKFCQ